MKPVAEPRASSPGVKPSLPKIQVGMEFRQGLSAQEVIAGKLTEVQIDKIVDSEVRESSDRHAERIEAMRP